MYSYHQRVSGQQRNLDELYTLSKAPDNWHLASLEVDNSRTRFRKRRIGNASGQLTRVRIYVTMLSDELEETVLALELS